MKKIMIVDDHPIVRRGLAHLIAQEEGLEVCGQAGNSPEALGLAREYRPDLVTVDLQLNGSHGMDLIKGLRQQFPATRILVISMYEEALYAERVLRAGAHGYVMKHEMDETVIRAIRKILDGGIYLSESMGDRILQGLAGTRRRDSEHSVRDLSDREYEVFRAIGRGVTSRELAERFHISVKTVDTYRTRIKMKLHLASTAQLAQYAIEWTAHEGGVRSEKLEGKK